MLRVDHTTLSQQQAGDSLRRWCGTKSKLPAAVRANVGSGFCLASAPVGKAIAIDISELDRLAHIYGIVRSTPFVHSYGHHPYGHHVWTFAVLYIRRTHVGRTYVCVLTVVWIRRTYVGRTYVNRRLHV